MLAVTAAAVIGGAIIVFIPAEAGRSITSWTEHLPLVGSTFARLLGAVRAFRGEKRLLFAAALVSVCQQPALHHVDFSGRCRIAAGPSQLGRSHRSLVPIANIVARLAPHTCWPRPQGIWPSKRSTR